jgi:hypothetical protein
VLRLYDAAAGRLVEVRPAIPRLLRVRASGGLRAHLVADLLRRAAERRGWRVTVVREAGAPDLDAFNIHPADEALPGGGADVDISPERPGSDQRHLCAVVAPAEVSTDDADPVSVRLALLGVHYRAPAQIGTSALREADMTLRRWRDRVATWAESPSRPMRAEPVQRVYAAYDDDLDTPTALSVLRDLEADDGIPPGSRFEAFVHLDRLLGLDLAASLSR